MDSVDLNNLRGREYPKQHDNGCISGTTETIFRNHRRRLLQLFQEAIRRGWVCFAAAAWLTDPQILDAMAKLPCAVIAQKEDFLRPDFGEDESDRERWTARLHRKYRAIEDSDQIGQAGGYFQRQHMPHPLCDMSETGDPGIAGVRCFGLRNDRSGDTPRRRPLMHHKFLAFAELSLRPVTGSGQANPYEAVEWNGQVLWTGSCNLSRMAMRSREAGYIMRDPVAADAHIREWAQIAALSEPLDWTSAWIDPQWRLGS